jgi:acyl-[acyl-carrier-protein]-phospholipid O-acyltransferase/long-chain-fatty-acid--[acyl-carrier-protein] ligase
LVRDLGESAVLHWLAWLLARLVYRLRVVGLENLPKSGPVLLVSNHVSYADWLVLMAASPRKIRFVIASDFVRNPFFGWILRLVRVIPIGRRAGPKAIVQTFAVAGEALRRGEVVCVFPEGYPTRNGVMLPFHRGFERIAQIEPVPVVPVYLDQLWGSIFSYKRGRLFWKRSERGPFPVTVAFGQPLSNPVAAPRVRQVIAEMAAETAKDRARHLLPVHRQFVRKAARHPFRGCLIDTASGPKPRVLNCAKVLAGAMCLARWLRPRLGDEPMVGVWLPSSVGGALTNLALALSHKTVVNLNYTAGAGAVRSAVEQCSLRHVVTSERFLHRMPLDLGPGVQLVKLEEALAGISGAQRTWAYLRTVLLPGWLLDRLLGLRRHQGSDLATVIFSSGSTGEPKGVMLTQQNIAANIDAFVSHVNFSPRDRVLGTLPFFHSFGYTVTLWGALMAGATTVHHPDPRAAKEVGELCRTFGCTLMASTATFLRLYLRRCQPEDFKTMRLLVCGAEKLPPPLIQDFKERFGVEPLEGYGCTELSPVVSVNIPDVTVNGVTQVGKKIGSIGHPLPGVAAKVVDPETNQPLDFDVEGLLLVTGPNVMKGYLGREDLTCKALVAGWYNTGDIGRIDADGFITLTGRLARFAKIGGEMIPLERLEEEMHKLLGSTDRVVAVVGVPDKRRGERLVVLYLPVPGVSIPSLLQRLGETGLPNLWIPDARDGFVIPEFPTLGSGKLDLQRLRDIAVEQTSGHERN